MTTRQERIYDNDPQKSHGGAADSIAASSRVSPLNLSPLSSTSKRDGHQIIKLKSNSNGTISDILGSVAMQLPSLSNGSESDVSDVDSMHSGNGRLSPASPVVTGNNNPTIISSSSSATSSTHSSDVIGPYVPTLGYDKNGVLVWDPSFTTGTDAASIDDDDDVEITSVNKTLRNGPTVLVNNFVSTVPSKALSNNSLSKVSHVPVSNNFGMHAAGSQNSSQSGIPSKSKHSAASSTSRQAFTHGPAVSRYGDAFVRRDNTSHKKNSLYADHRRAENLVSHENSVVDDDDNDDYNEDEEEAYFQRRRERIKAGLPEFSGSDSRSSSEVDTDSETSPMSRTNRRSVNQSVNSTNSTSNKQQLLQRHTPQQKSVSKALQTPTLKASVDSTPALSLFQRLSPTSGASPNSTLSSAYIKSPLPMLSSSSPLSTSTDVSKMQDEKATTVLRRRNVAAGDTICNGKGKNDSFNDDIEIDVTDVDDAPIVNMIENNSKVPKTEMVDNSNLSHMKSTSTSSKRLNWWEGVVDEEANKKSFLDARNMYIDKISKLSKHDARDDKEWAIINEIQKSQQQEQQKEECIPDRPIATEIGGDGGVNSGLVSSKYTPKDRSVESLAKRGMQLTQVNKKKNTNTNSEENQDAKSRCKNGEKSIDDKISLPLGSITNTKPNPKILISKMRKKEELEQKEKEKEELRLQMQRDHDEEVLVRIAWQQSQRDLQALDEQKVQMKVKDDDKWDNDFGFDDDNDELIDVISSRKKRSNPNAYIASKKNDNVNLLSTAISSPTVVREKSTYAILEELAVLCRREAVERRSAAEERYKNLNQIDNAKSITDNCIFLHNKAHLKNIRERSSEIRRTISQKIKKGLYFTAVRVNPKMNHKCTTLDSMTSPVLRDVVATGEQNSGDVAQNEKMAMFMKQFNELETLDDIDEGDFGRNKRNKHVEEAVLKRKDELMMQEMQKVAKAQIDSVIMQTQDNISMFGNKLLGASLPVAPVLSDTVANVSTEKKKKKKKPKNKAKKGVETSDDINILKAEIVNDLRNGALKAFASTVALKTPVFVPIMKVQSKTESESISTTGSTLALENAKKNKALISDKKDWFKNVGRCLKSSSESGELLYDNILSHTAPIPVLPTTLWNRWIPSVDSSKTNLIDITSVSNISLEGRRFSVFAHRVSSTLVMSGLIEWLLHGTKQPVVDNVKQQEHDLWLMGLRVVAMKMVSSDICFETNKPINSSASVTIATGSNTANNTKANGKKKNKKGSANDNTSSSSIVKVASDVVLSTITVSPMASTESLPVLLIAFHSDDINANSLDQNCKSFLKSVSCKSVFSLDAMQHVKQKKMIDLLQCVTSIKGVFPIQSKSTPVVDVTNSNPLPTASNTISNQHPLHLFGTLPAFYTYSVSLSSSSPTPTSLSLSTAVVDTDIADVDMLPRETTIVILKVHDSLALPLTCITPSPKIHVDMSVILRKTMLLAIDLVGFKLVYLTVAHCSYLSKQSWCRSYADILLPNQPYVILCFRGNNSVSHLLSIQNDLLTCDDAGVKNNNYMSVSSTLANAKKDYVYWFGPRLPVPLRFAIGSDECNENHDSQLWYASPQQKYLLRPLYEVFPGVVSHVLIVLSSQLTPSSYGRFVQILRIRGFKINSFVRSTKLLNIQLMQKLNIPLNLGVAGCHKAPAISTVNDEEMYTIVLVSRENVDDHIDGAMDAFAKAAGYLQFLQEEWYNTGLYGRLKHRSLKERMLAKSRDDEVIADRIRDCIHIVHNVYSLDREFVSVLLSNSNIITSTDVDIDINKNLVLDNAINQIDSDVNSTDKSTKTMASEEHCCVFLSMGASEIRQVFDALLLPGRPHSKLDYIDGEYGLLDEKTLQHANADDDDDNCYKHCNYSGNAINAVPCMQLVAMRMVAPVYTYCCHIHDVNIDDTMKLNSNCNSNMQSSISDKNSAKKNKKKKKVEEVHEKDIEVKEKDTQEHKNVHSLWNKEILFADVFSSTANAVTSSSHVSDQFCTNVINHFERNSVLVLLLKGVDCIKHVNNCLGPWSCYDARLAVSSGASTLSPLRAILDLNDSFTHVVASTTPQAAKKQIDTYFFNESITWDDKSIFSTQKYDSMNKDLSPDSITAVMVIKPTGRDVIQNQFNVDYSGTDTATRSRTNSLDKVISSPLPILSIQSPLSSQQKQPMLPSQKEPAVAPSIEQVLSFTQTSNTSLFARFSEIVKHAAVHNYTINSVKMKRLTVKDVEYLWMQDSSTLAFQQYIANEQIKVKSNHMTPHLEYKTTAKKNYFHALVHQTVIIIGWSGKDVLFQWHADLGPFDPEIAKKIRPFTIRANIKQANIIHNYAYLSATSDAAQKDFVYFLSNDEVAKNAPAFMDNSLANVLSIAEIGVIVIPPALVRGGYTNVILDRIAKEFEESIGSCSSNNSTSEDFVLLNVKSCVLTTLSALQYMRVHDSNATLSYADLQAEILAADKGPCVVLYVAANNVIKRIEDNIILKGHFKFTIENHDNTNTIIDVLFSKTKQNAAQEVSFFSFI